MTKSTPKKQPSKTVATKKAAPKKPTSKKTARRKALPPLNSPTVSAGAKAAAKSLTAVKTRAAKAKPKAQRKVTKTTTAQKTAAKPRSASLSKPSKETAETLRKAMDSLESRMKRANTLTRKSVKALETSIAALDAKTKKDGAAHKAALTRNVNQLSTKLTNMVEQTQSSVNAELRTALKNPSLEGLHVALSRADARLTQAESVQAAAISKINRHLAAIATAVEARLNEEARARETAITALKAETHARIDTVESDTATALSRAGDKIAELAAELQNRNDASELSIREKVSEIALQTQAEFEQYRSSIETRIEAIETTEQGDVRRLYQSIASLTSRIEGLEYGLAALPVMDMSATDTTSMDTAEVQATAIPVMTAPTAPQLTLVETAPLQSEYNPAPISAPAQTPTALPDAFTPLTSLPNEQVATPPNPYLSAQAEPEAEPILQDSHIPVEFDPSQFQWSQPQSGNQAQAQRQAAAPEPVPFSPPAPETTTPPAKPVSIETMLPMAETQLPPMTTAAAPQTSGAIPYADPAYAETDPTMAAERIGGGAGRKLNLPKLPKLTGRNLGVTALATGVAVLGLITAKSVLGGDPVGPPQIQTATTENPALPVATEAAAESNVPMVDPIGDYADNKAITVTGDAATTLNSAAAAGDPIAQFQLGLSYLEKGRTDEAVTLIRKAANQNQPAAQYRLAKLYEVGEGVEQDAEMARQLTERAARNGNRIAMHDLALYYAEGRGGVEAELTTAAKWFEKAAERGVVDSQFNLGVLFESGQGLPKNVTDAFVWYSIAAGQGDQFAKTRIDVLKDTLPETELASAAGRVETFTPVKIDEAANGIFRDVPWAKPANTASAKKTQVKQAQTLLGELGYDIGGADGAMGPRTRAAIISFERANSLPETGRVNTTLLDRLELAAGA